MCCNRRWEWTAHLTRHIFSLIHIWWHAHARFKAQVWRAQRTFHSIPSSCAHDVLTLCDSPFHFLLSTFSPIVLFILLVSTFHDVVDKFPVHSLMRTLTPLPSTTLSEIIYGQNCGRNWEEMPSWGRGKSGHMKNLNSIMQENYEEFISLTLRRGVQRNHQECQKNWKHQWLPPCFERHDPKQDYWFQVKVCVYLGSQWIHKNAYGRISTESSWGPYCTERGQVTATL